MATQHHRFVTDARSAPRAYTVCYFNSDWVIPTVEFVDAETDQEAIAVARSRRLYMTREIWDRHRLVAVIPPSLH